MCTYMAVSHRKAHEKERVLCPHSIWFHPSVPPNVRQPARLFARLSCPAAVSFSKRLVQHDVYIEYPFLPRSALLSRVALTQTSK